MIYDIFISYSRKDAKKVFKYANQLEKLGYKIWIDKDNIYSGDAFREIIVTSLKNSSAVLFFSSEDSNKSKWTAAEIAIAAEEKKVIIPIRLDDSAYNDSIRMDLAILDYIDGRGKTSDVIERLNKTLEYKLGKHFEGNINSTKNNSTIKNYRYSICFCILIAIIGLTLLLVNKSQLINNTQSVNGIENDTPGASTIDKNIEAISRKLLKHKMSEIYASKGQVLVIETNTGYIKASVQLERDDSDNFKNINTNCFNNESSLMKVISILACLNKNSSISKDSIDTLNGIYAFPDSTIIYDHNWYRGGYGIITVPQIIMFSSNVGICRLVCSLYGVDGGIDFYEAIKKMGYGQIEGKIPGLSITHNAHFSHPDSPYFWLGYNQKIDTYQTLAFLNSIPASGILYKPQAIANSPIIINKSIASDEVIQEMKAILRLTVTKGVSRKASADELDVSGFSGTMDLDNREANSSTKDDNYLMQFYGYFPSQAPKYSVLISMEKKGSPASGGNMCGPIFSDLADMLSNYK